MALGDKVRAHMQRRVAAVIALSQNVAGRAESDMKAHAEWTDRSGLARGGLRGEAVVHRSPGDTRISVVLSHTMDYGGLLETVNGAAMGRRAGMSMAELAERQNAGNFAVIWPTADRIGPEYIRNRKRVWGDV